MSSSSFFPAEPCTTSLGLPYRDTEKCWTTSSSWNALFDVQQTGVHVDLMGRSHSPASGSTSCPAYLTEPYQPVDDTSAASESGTFQRPVSVITRPELPSGLKFDFLNWTEQNDACWQPLMLDLSIPAWDGAQGLDRVSCSNSNLAFDRELCYHLNDEGPQPEADIKHFTDSPRRVRRCTSLLQSNNVDLEEVLASDLRCNWPQCSTIDEFGSIGKYKSHIKHHADEVSNSWSPGRKCTWHKCSSKATHRRRNVFEAHVNNIHVNPLVCTVKHCKHKTPFRANHDLQRHIATAHHVDSRYSCPYVWCGGQGFIRKDKWIRHLREHHDTEPCPYAHCKWRTENIPVYQRSVSKHIGKAHSDFECALKSCNGKVSRFAERELLEHLQLHHAMEWASVLNARDMIKAEGKRTLTTCYFMQDLEVHDCKICTEGS